MVTSPNDLFCPTNSPKPKYIQFSVVWNKETQQILTLEKLTPENVWHFSQVGIMMELFSFDLFIAIKSQQKLFILGSYSCNKPH